jgi:carbamoyl-phosphate synthase large subunit
MIFGAGLNQLSMIKTAKENGYYTIVIDPSTDPPGRILADEFHKVGKADFLTTRDIAAKSKAQGIVTSQMENPLKLMSRLAQDLGFIFHSPNVIENSTNKYAMKQAFLAHNIACARGSLVEQASVLSEEEFYKLSPPLVMKPPQSFSSRGVFKVDNYQAYLSLLDTTLSFSLNGSYLLEEFIEGPEYSIESISYRGRTTIVQYTKKIITPYPNTVEIGHIQPADLDSSQRDVVENLVVRALKALGIDNSASHTELKFTKNGPVIIEIGPRLGGDYISSYLTQTSTGVDMDLAAVKVALGEEPNLIHTKEQGAAIVYLQLPPGKLIKEIDYEKFGQIEDKHLIQKHLVIRVGDRIRPISDSSDRLGWVIVDGQNAFDAYQRGEFFLERIKQTIRLVD